MDKRKNYIKVGIFTIIVICMTLVLITWKSRIFVRAGGYEVVGSFKTISGLAKGAPVRYRGYQIGTVAKIEPTHKDIRVTIWIKKRYQSK
ncbi:MlaD family protein [Candidatus Margulisiibacteriota bacterium]